MFDNFGIQNYKYNPEYIFKTPIFQVYVVDTEYKGHKYKKAERTILKNIILQEHSSLINGIVYHTILIPEDLKISIKEQIYNILTNECIEKNRNYKILDSNFYYE